MRHSYNSANLVYIILNRLLWGPEEEAALVTIWPLESTFLSLKKKKKKKKLLNYGLQTCYHASFK